MLNTGYIINYYSQNKDGKKKSKAIPVTGRDSPQGCEKSRLPFSFDIRLTDGGKVLSLPCRPPFNPQEDSWYSFLLEVESTPPYCGWKD
jgi:hypothetical protein